MADDDMEPRDTPAIADVEADHCIKILLATDNHIGYAERDPVRGRDSINSFQEILELAVENDVDMLLLAGDLFHENKPSRSSLYQTIGLLRQYCMGRRPISFQMISDAGMGLGRTYDFPQINYEDENLNVGLPVFSIHGNHDDPQGAGSEGALCALDILSASGLINYFGRQELPGNAVDDEEAREQGIQVKPLLIQKGDTRLAMYGIGNMRDERFYAEMRRNRISLFKPSEDEADWFNLLLIHQNRATHTPKSSVPEDGFGDDVDLIIWGHEHDCRIEPEPVTGRNYYISQPGSSIATSLAEGESKQKHVAILKIQGRKFALTPIPLRSVRPFVIDEVNLNEAQENGVDLSSRVNVTKFLKSKVNDMLQQAQKEWTELHQDDEGPVAKMLPLVRLRVFYEGSFETGNPQRFGQDFAQRVANPRDIITFTRRKKPEARTKVTIDVPDADGMEVDADDRPFDKIKVETLVHEYLQAQQLEVIAENGMAQAIDLFVDKDDTNAIKDFVKAQLEERRVMLGTDQSEQQDEEKQDSEDELLEAISKAKIQAVQRIEETGYKRSKEKGQAVRTEREEEDSNNSFGYVSEDLPAANGENSKEKGKGSELFRAESDDASQVSRASSRRPAAGKRTPAKIAPAKTKTSTTAKQSQLSFAPGRGRGAPRAASSKANKAMSVEISSDEDDADLFIDDDDSDDRPRKRQVTKKR